MENKIDILITAKDEASKVMKNLGGTIANSEKMFKNMALVGGVAFGAISGVIYKSVEASKESQRVNTQLEAVLKSTGGAVGLTAKEIQAHSAALQKNLGISDEAIATGQNMLLTFTNIGKDTFPKATETLLDMATAMNGGMAPSAEALSAQAIQLGKALNDPIKGISALSRVGVTFTDQQKETIQSMVDMGDTAGAQKIILDELAREFGGSALAQAQTFEGQMNKLKVSFGDIFENIGLALIPALQKLAEFVTPVIQKMADWASANPELVTKIILVAGAIAGLVTAIGIIGLVIPPLISGFTLIGGAFTAVATASKVLMLGLGPIGWTILAIGAIVALVAVAWQKDWGGIQEKTMGAIEWIKGGLEAFGAWIYPYVQMFLTAVKDFWAKWGGDIMAVVSVLWETIKLQTEIFFEIIKGVFKVGMQIISGDWSGAWETIKQTFITVGSQIVEAGKIAFTAFQKVVEGIVGAVWEYVRAKLQAIRDTVREIASLGRANTQTFNGSGVAGARAKGGPVSGGSTYLVGERGPELFTPASSGNITPNNQLGGVTISINMGGVSVRNESDINGIAKAVADQLTRSLQLAKLGVS